MLNWLEFGFNGDEKNGGSIQDEVPVDGETMTSMREHVLRSQ